MIYLLIDDDVRRLRKITVNALRVVEGLSSSCVSSAEVAVQLAIKKNKSNKKKLKSCSEEVIEKRPEILLKELRVLKKAEAKYKKAENNLSNYLFDISGIREEYRDNFCYEFDGRRNQISIYFGGKGGKPDGASHGHCALDAYTLRLRAPIRYPGEPHRVKEKKCYKSRDRKKSPVPSYV